MHCEKGKEVPQVINFKYKTMKKIVKRIKVTKYIAIDGKEFESEKECKDYEEIIRENVKFVIFDSDNNEVTINKNSIKNAFAGFNCDACPFRRECEDCRTIDRTLCDMIMYAGYGL